MEMLINLYRKYISKKYRDVIYQLFLRRILNYIRARNRDKINDLLAVEIPKYYLANNISCSEECLCAANWICNNGFSVFPYDYTFKYKSIKIEVYCCKESGLKYVLHDNKRLYFPKEFSKRNCVNYYLGLLEEQDVASPHRYNYDPFYEKHISTLLDIGAAEGIFALSVIDYVDKVYLFECDSHWWKALEWTFKPYEDKVEIVHRYVSDQSDEKSLITIDSFLFNKRKFSSCYIKMDIEGAELSALMGSTDSLNKESVYLSVCTYHTDKDAEFIHKFLVEYGFECRFTFGVMAFGTTPPYFRKGVLYANK